MSQALLSRFTGFILSMILTLAAYFIIVEPEFFHFDPKSAVMIIFTLALIQSIVQLVFFIHVWKEKGPLWNLITFLSTVAIIFIVIYFSIWIINHLNDHMMP